MARKIANVERERERVTLAGGGRQRREHKVVEEKKREMGAGEEDRRVRKQKCKRVESIKNLVQPCKDGGHRAAMTPKMETKNWK